MDCEARLSGLTRISSVLDFLTRCRLVRTNLVMAAADYFRIGDKPWASIKFPLTRFWITVG
jgi:hypothetical protein